jgi:hypothetical protein
VLKKDVKMSGSQLCILNSHNPTGKRDENSLSVSEGCCMYALDMCGKEKGEKIFRVGITKEGLQ